MSIQLRRGTNAERALITPLEGEVIYTTDTKLVYIGDGVTLGGVQVSGSGGLSGSLAGLVDLGNYSITGTGLTINGNTGDITATSFNGIFNGSLGSNLAINTRSITNGSGLTISGNSGNINTTGTVTANSFIGNLNGSLAANLYINTYNINNNGNTLILNGSTGAITATGLTTPKLTINNTGIIGTGPRSGPNNFGSTLSIGSATQPNTVLQYSDQVLQSYYGIQQAGTFGTHFIEHRISRGTLSAPSVSQPGDLSGVTKALGYDGSSYVPFTIYGGIIDPTTTVSTNSIGGGFFAATFKPGGGQPSTLLFSSAGILSVPVLQVGTLAGSGAYPTSPVAGMIIFDSNVNHFYGYNGSTWKQLDNL